MVTKYNKDFYIRKPKMAEYRLPVLKKSPKTKNLPFIEPASKKVSLKSSTQQ